MYKSDAGDVLSKAARVPGLIRTRPLYLQARFTTQKPSRGGADSALTQPNQTSSHGATGRRKYLKTKRPFKLKSTVGHPCKTNLVTRQINVVLSLGWSYILLSILIILYRSFFFSSREKLIYLVLAPEKSFKMDGLQNGYPTDIHRFAILKYCACSTSFNIDHS